MLTGPEASASGLELFFALRAFLGAFFAIGTALATGRWSWLSGTKLCLFIGGAVDLRAVGCLAFFGLERFGRDWGLVDFFLFLD